MSSLLFDPFAVPLLYSSRMVPYLPSFIHSYGVLAYGSSNGWVRHWDLGSGTSTLQPPVSLESYTYTVNDRDSVPQVWVGPEF